MYFEDSLVCSLTKKDRKLPEENIQQIKAERNNMDFSKI